MIPLFILWQTGVVCTMTLIAGLDLVGTFSFRDHHASPRGNAIILTVLTYVWFISIPVFALLCTWKFGDAPRRERDG
jgi:hypothetical protein